MILEAVQASEIWVPIVVALASAVGGAIGLDIYLHFKNKGKKAIERRKKEKQEEFKEVVVPCIEEAIKPLNDKMGDVEQKVDAMAGQDLPLLKQANRDSLRNQLFASYRHCAKLGFRTIEDTNNWEAMYESYIALGGNGFMPEIKEKFMKIPLEDLALLKTVVRPNTTTKKPRKSKGE